MKNWRIYQDAHGEWRWWKLDEQGNIALASDVGFSSKQECQDNAAASGYPE